MSEIATETREEALEWTANALLDAVIWMSGSSDFGPEGEAAAEWERVRESVVVPALNFLRQTPMSTIEQAAERSRETA